MIKEKTIGQTKERLKALSLSFSLERRHANTTKRKTTTATLFELGHAFFFWRCLFFLFVVFVWVLRNAVCTCVSNPRCMSMCNVHEGPRVCFRLVGFCGRLRFSLLPAPFVQSLEGPLLRARARAQARAQLGVPARPLCEGTLLPG